MPLSAKALGLSAIVAHSYVSMSTTQTSDGDLTSPLSDRKGTSSCPLIPGVWRRSRKKMAGGFGYDPEHGATFMLRNGLR